MLCHIDKSRKTTDGHPFQKKKFLCSRNDIGHELIDDNNMIYLPLYIVTHSMYSTTRKLIS
jgi:hypothetical protein